MLHTDAAQQRPGNSPASAPEASQKQPRAQTQANSEFPASQLMHSQPGDTTAADLTAGTMDISHTSLIHGGLTPPPPWNPTPHVTTPTLQQVLDPAKIGRAQHELRARLARYHSVGEGNEQAGRSSLQPRREPTPYATTTTLHPTHPTKNANLSLKHTTGFARHHPLGEGHVQAARRRQGQQLYAWYGTPSRRPQAAPPFPLTPAGEVIQPKPPTLPPEAWASECNTNKAKQPKRDKVFLNTTHC